MKKRELIVMGISAGGMETLSRLFPAISKNHVTPIVIVQHISRTQDLHFTINYYRDLSGLNIKEADEKEEIKENTIYFAPPDYHLLIEEDKTFSLSVEERVRYSRPSINVLFSSAANVYFDRLIAIVMTGANDDGTEGSIEVKNNGGIVIIQDPEEASTDVMPRSVMRKVKVDKKLKVKEIAEYINNL